MRCTVGIDTGGTFTDIVLFDGKRIHHEKIPSQPENPALAVKKGAELVEGEIEYLIHGTTVGTNAVLEGKGASVALVTTKGFTDVIEIGRQTRPALYDFFLDRAEPLVSRKHRFEIEERMDHKGRVIVPLKKRKIVGKIKKCGCASVAVCLLNSYANPIHERKIGAALGGFHVSLSSEVLNEYREYERFSTTVLDAYTRPVMSDYLSCLDFAFPVYVMQSNGGILGVSEAVKKSVATLLSGPAAGIRGATYFSRLSGFLNLLTFDMGGTSTDVCLVENGEARFSRERRIGGHPYSLPMIDIHTVGAGGGSIAWMDSGGALHVGPQSAGADPGPACYGKGKKATVTDADLLLGYINPDYFLEGKMRLSRIKSETAVKDIAKKLKAEMLETAWGIFSIVNANMIGALRVISIQKGVDPKDFVLFAFGGAGPVHGAFLAQELGVKGMIVPRIPGVFSAFGLLVSDKEEDFSCTKIVLAEEMTDRQAWRIFKKLEKKKGIYARSCDVRYSGQSYEIEIPFFNLRRLRKDFDEAHKVLYGYSSEDRIEIVNFKTKWVERIKKPRIKKIGRRDSREALKEKRMAFFHDRFFESDVYERNLLGADSKIPGPAIIEEETSTTVIPPKFDAHVDETGTIFVKVKG